MTNDDPFRQSVPSVSFKDVPIGHTYTLRVLEGPEVVQSRDYDTGLPATWPDGNPKMSVVTRVVDLATGEERGLWAARPSGMYAAISAAQSKAGAQIKEGGVLEVSYVGEKPSDNPRKAPAKIYAVVYTPPSAFGEEPAPAATGATGPSTAGGATTARSGASPGASAGPSPEQIAAVRAAGLDPAEVFAGR